MVEELAQRVNQATYRRTQHDNGLKEKLRFQPEEAYPQALSELSCLQERFSRTPEVSVAELLEQAELFKWTIKVLTAFNQDWRVYVQGLSCVQGMLIYLDTVSSADKLTLA